MTQPRLIGEAATFWKNTSSVLAGTVIAQAITLIGLTIVGRLYAPSDFGQFATWISLVTITTVILSASFETSLAVVSDGAERDVAIFSTLATVGFISVAGSIGFSILAIISPNSFGLSPALLATLIPAAMVYAASQCWDSYAAAEGTYNWLSALRVIQALLIITFQLAAGIYQPSAEALALGFSLGAGLSLMLWSKFFPIKLPPLGVRWTTLQNFWYSQRNIPIFALPANLSNTIAAQLPIIIVANRFGAEYAGYLGMTNRILGAPVTLLGRSVLDVFKRYASVSYRENGNCKTQYLQAMWVLAFGALIFCGGMVFLAKPAVETFLGPNWAISGQMAIWLVPLFSLRFIASPLSYTFYIAGLQHVNLVWQLALLITTIATLSFANSAELSIKSYAFSYSALYLVYIYLSYRCSLGNRN